MRGCTCGHSAWSHVVAPYSDHYDHPCTQTGCLCREYAPAPEHVGKLWEILIKGSNTLWTYDIPDHETAMTYVGRVIAIRHAYMLRPFCFVVRQQKEKNGGPLQWDEIQKMRGWY